MNPTETLKVQADDTSDTRMFTILHFLGRKHDVEFASIKSDDDVMCLKSFSGEYLHEWVGRYHLLLF